MGLGAQTARAENAAQAPAFHLVSHSLPGPGRAEPDVDSRERLAPAEVALQLQRRLATPDGDDYVVVRRQSPPPEIPAARVLLLLVNGDRLTCESLRCADDVCTFAPLVPEFGPERELPMDFVRGAVFRPQPAEAADAAVLQRLERPLFSSDTLLLVGQDRLSGEFVAWTADGPTWRTAAGEVTVAESRIRAVAFNPDLWRPLTLGPENAAVALADGSLLSGRCGEIGPTHCEWAPAEGAPWRIPWSLIEQLEVHGPQTRLLSSEPPTSAEWTPFLPRLGEGAAPRTEPSRTASPAAGANPQRSAESTVFRDRQPLGGLLSLRGRRLLRGLGVRSESRMTFPLRGEAVVFRATVGVDDAAERGGAVVFALLVDGERVWSSPILTGADAPADVDVRLPPGKELTLLVEYGPGADILDLAVWGAPRLVSVPRP